MRATRVLACTAVFGFALAASMTAQAAAPKDATGQCTDGSYTTAKTQEKGCLKHGGVKSWFGGASAATTTAASAAGPAPRPSPRETSAAPDQATTSSKVATAPKDATGQCTDGSYTTAKTQQRGCTKHGGVKTWFAGASASAPAAVAPAAAPAVPAATPKAAAAPASASTPAAPPANPGDVWVNTSTKAYHCPGTKYYGTTKHGRYMSEAEAKAAGFHPSYGKACT